MATSEANMPSDDEIVAAISTAKISDPNLSRNDLFAKVKSLHFWNISKNQMKKALDPKPPPSSTNTNPASTPFPGPPLPPITLPTNALAAQQAYKDNSTRLFRLYGHGGYDYGCGPNADQQIRIEIMHQRLLDAGCPGPFSDAARKHIGSAGPLQEMLKFYYAAGK
jgi:hypothetical protein